MMIATLTRLPLPFKKIKKMYNTVYGTGFTSNPNPTAYTTPITNTGMPMQQTVYTQPPVVMQPQVIVQPTPVYVPPPMYHRPPPPMLHRPPPPIYGPPPHHYHRGPPPPHYRHHRDDCFIF